MRPFTKILFWIYFAAASAALVVVIIYLFNRYNSFSAEFKYESQKKIFTKYFNLLQKNDSTFTSLFNQDSKEAIDFLNRSESYLKNVDFKSKSIQINSEHLASLDSLFRSWPKKYKDIARKNIVAIFLVDTARFNGLLQIIPSTEDRFIIYLKSSLFRQTPNTWITNESTKVLKNELSNNVEYILYKDSDNIPLKTVEHVLLHEFSHILSFLSHEAPLPDGNLYSKKGYYPLIETCFEGGEISYYSLNPSLEKFIALSKNASDPNLKLNYSEFKNLTRDLSFSSFPTPYSTSNASELVAESFTYYVHHYYQKNKFLAIFDKTDTIHFAQKIDTLYISKIVN